MKYHIIIKEDYSGEPYFKEVEGKPIKLPGLEEYDFFIHRPSFHPAFKNLEKRLWAISEVQTGLCAIPYLGVRDFPKTQKQAIKIATARLMENRDKIDAELQKHIKKYGPAPKAAEV